ncbi:MAG: imidazoleglycerol-phosphate dehydratase HisB [Planctomycetota bacterium]
MTSLRTGPLPAGAPLPVSALQGVAPYEPPPPDPRVELDLASNVGVGEPARWRALLAELPPERLATYPEAHELEAALAARWGLPGAGCLVTAGADEALDRLCRAYLAPGRELLLPAPTFAMLPRYAALTGCEQRVLPWPGGAFPREAFLAAITPRTALIAVVSPNNPTGCVATPADLAALSAAAPHAVLLLDAAYMEYADEDATGPALALPNAVVTRTFSKAHGLAGLRVGFALGAPALLAPLRALSPYPVAGPSLWLAERALASGPDATALAQARAERAALAALAAEAGYGAEPSQANFVLLRGLEAEAFRAALLAHGVAVRTFPGRPELSDAARITCPGEPRAFARLRRALRAVWGLATEAADEAREEAEDLGPRRARVRRTTRETDITVELALDGSGAAEVSTGMGFLDHMLCSLAKHGGLDLAVRCRGDLVIDDHHSVEDVALTLGAALDRALGERRGLERFGDAAIAMDEALARAAVDLSGRPFAKVALGLRREALGAVACENLTHFFQSLATAARLTLNLAVPEGENDHHRAEAAFKAFARALRRAASSVGGDAVPSTKGVL